MPEDVAYPTKDTARQGVWDALQEGGVARFSYPPHGRISNSAGAGRLLEHPAFEEVRAIKANLEAPQRPLRPGLGITVYMPTPRLRCGFYRLSPSRILKAAASLSGVPRRPEAGPLETLASTNDLVVTGSVAVTPSGRRCGKDHG